MAESPDHKVVAELANPNSIHAFKWFEEEDHTERTYKNLRLIDSTWKEFFSMWVPAVPGDYEL